MAEDQEKTERVNDDDSLEKETVKKTSRLHGLVVKQGGEGHVTVMCAAVALSARLPLNSPVPIRPGCWVNFEMDLVSGENQIVAECEPRYKTHLFDDGSFAVLSPATYYLEEDMPDSDYSVAYTPYFRFVDDPKGLLQKIDWMEWYEVLLTPADNCAYLLKVERLVRSMTGCIEPGSLPGQLPSNAQITAAIEADTPRNSYEGVKEITSSQLGLCIGHATYDRVESSVTGKFSGYGSGRGAGRGNVRGRGGNDGYSNYNNYNNYNQRGGGGGRVYGGRGGGGRGWDNNGGHDDWRRARDDRGGGGGGSRADGDWRVARREERNDMPSQQHQRTESDNIKKVVASLIFTTRGIVMSKLEEERYEEGDWITFDKTARTDMTVQRQAQGRDTYPPYLLQHRLTAPGYGGECRVQGARDDWNIQIKVLVEFGQLRQKGWMDPSFFGKIECNEMMLRKAKRRLETEKREWTAMSEKLQDAVHVNVWIGMPAPEMLHLPAMSPFPNKIIWQVRELHENEFIHDLPLDVARRVGAVPTIVL